MLKAGAAVGQQRPRLAESADLLRNAIFIRLRRMKLQPSGEYRHTLLWIGVRVLSALWLLMITAILCTNGYWLGVVLVAPAALHFYLAYRLMHIIPRDRW